MMIIICYYLFFVLLLLCYCSFDLFDILLFYYIIITSSIAVVNKQVRSRKYQRVLSQSSISLIEFQIEAIDFKRPGDSAFFRVLCLSIRRCQGVSRVTSWWPVNGGCMRTYTGSTAKNI